MYLLCLLVDAAVSSIRALLWFPLVTGQAKRMTGSLVKISPPLSTAYLPPLHWTVARICCHENRPHLCKWEGHFASLAFHSRAAHVSVCLSEFTAHLRNVPPLYVIKKLP